MDTPRPLSLPPSAVDRLLGVVFLLAWRTVGLLALPIVLLHPRARRHAWRVPAPEPGRTWIHGASAGEHRVVAALRMAHGPGIWPTSGSLRTRVPTAAPAPWDLPFVVERWLDRARPGRVILIESALWPGWIAACRRRGIPITIVHAREGRGTARWRRLGPLWRWLGEGVGTIPQTDTGDLKAEAPSLPGPSIQGPFIVGASTREGDEARLLAAWKRLPDPRPRLVIAPRHEGRFDEAHAVLAHDGHTVRRRSEGSPLDTDIILLDSIGELAGVIEKARAVFVGGTFDPSIGGHSPTEATAAGVPVFAGPHIAANPAAWSEARSHHAGTDTPEALAEALVAALALGTVEPRADTGRAQAVLSRLPPPAAREEGPARPWLRPLVPVVHALARRRSAYRGRVETAPVPVISVGGLTAGGSGKTPVAAWLAAQLPDTWVVGRGYRRPGGGKDARIGRPGTEPLKPLGDELEMLRRRGICVVSCPDRVRGARAAAEAGARLVVLDDGFQHRRLHRDLDIVCIDARWPTGRGPIPVGSGREDWDALARADVVWVHHAPSLERPWAIPGPGGARPQVRSRAIARGWRMGGQVVPLDAPDPGGPVVCGLARPGTFLGQLADLGFHIDDVTILGDHAPLDAIRPGCRMTEKDAARLPADAPVLTLLQRLDVAGGDAVLAPARALLDGAP